MPIYEYQCNSCGAVFDQLQKLSDPDPTACPNCTNPQIARRLTAPAFRLAGSGWYETDFKKEGDKKRNLAGGSDTPAPAANAEPAKPAKAETPAAKPAD